MGVLFDVYSGNVYPAEAISQCCAKNNCFKDEVAKNRKALEQCLPESAVPKLEAYVDSLNQRMSIELYLSFKYGLKLGLNLCKETMDDP